MSFSLTRKVFVLDTNFFISAFEKSPYDIKKFFSIVEELKIKIIASDLILNELRWYIRRRINNRITIVKTSIKEIRDLHSELQAKDIAVPQIADISNIILAREYNGIVVTSDLKLIKACEQIDTPVLTNSAFAYLISQEITSLENKEFINELYDVILSDEIRYSVSQSDLYDPVNRIKKIQLYAIKVLENLPSIERDKYRRSKGQELTAEENELLNLINEIGFEFSSFLERLQKGDDIEALKIELSDIYCDLSDSSLRVRIALKNRRSSVIELSTRIKARILFILSVVNFSLLDIKDLESNLNILSEIAATSPHLVSDLFMDLQFLRIVYLFISGKYERLNSYFSDSFTLLCSTENRVDLVNLTRAVIFATTLVDSGIVEEQALLEGEEELLLLVQLGYILLQLKHFAHALILLLQSYYIASKKKNVQLMKDTLELLIVVHYSTNEKISEEISRAINDLNEMSVYDTPVISSLSKSSLSNFVIIEPIDIEDAPSELQRWLYIYDHDLVHYNQSIAQVIYAINPYFWPKIAIVLEQKLNSYEIRPGRQLKIISGSISTELPTKSNEVSLHNVDLVIKIDKPTLSVRGTWGMKIIK